MSASEVLAKALSGSVGAAIPFRLRTGEAVPIASVRTTFAEWRGLPLADTYGGKATIDSRGDPTFAELAVVRELARESWSAVWIDTYRRRFRTSLPGIGLPVQLPPPAQAAFETIVATNHGKRGGAWDVFGWSGADILFAELKRLRRDRVQQTQTDWLEAALRAGFSREAFAVVEWELL